MTAILDTYVTKHRPLVRQWMHRETCSDVCRRWLRRPSETILRRRTVVGVCPKAQLFDSMLRHSFFSSFHSTFFSQPPTNLAPFIMAALIRFIVATGVTIAGRAVLQAYKNITSSACKDLNTEFVVYF